MNNLESLKRDVRFFYDLQKLRIQSGNRNNPKVPAELDEKDQEFMTATSLGLEALEKRTLREVKRLLKSFPIYTDWLKDQKGIGPTMAGVLISEISMTQPVEDLEALLAEFKDDGFEILSAEPGKTVYVLKDETGLVRRTRTLLRHRGEWVFDLCPHPSALWAYAGLAVDTSSGKAVRRKKGVKSNWNPFLKTKVVHVMGGCMIKANSPWRKFYDDYKHRKMSAGWGTSDGHRHNAAMRYMVKMFLQEMWNKWRELEGLPIVDTYAVAKLGVAHGDHANN